MPPEACRKKTFNDYDAYVNDVDQFYSTIYQDLFFIANSADALMKMRDMKESDSFGIRIRIKLL